MRIISKSAGLIIGMGVCNAAGKTQVIETRTMNESSGAPLRFYRTAHIHIYVETEAHKVVTDETLSFPLTEATISFSTQAMMGRRRGWVSGNIYSGCVLSGLDPRGGVKVCQDMVFSDSWHGALLTGVFDGHGPEGEPVASFCRRFMCDFWKRHEITSAEEPSEFLIVMMQECDKELKKSNNGIDCSGSGCTAVLVLYYQNTIYFASVGDSRAVLATTSPPEVLTAHEPPRREDKGILDQIKASRNIASTDTGLFAIQMTVDQKPEDPIELERILQCGGVVMRLEDETGRKVGPYRVWKVENGYPGIAMSRSLGDTLAHEIGVSSTPLTASREVEEGKDSFIVIGSDGVWDTMENQEVVDFIEAYRLKSVKNIEMPSYVDPIEPDNVTIAHLLCEEARARWLAIVESEDVLIDDVSCIVIELNASVKKRVKAPQRTVKIQKEVVEVEGLTKGLKRAETKIRDPKRECVAELPTTITRIEQKPEVEPAEGAKPPSVQVKDLRRSSILRDMPPKPPPPS